MKKVAAHLPEWRSLIGVYAVAVFLAYSWTLLASFWKVPSWLFYLKIGEILSVYAYAFVLNFAESLLLLLLMVLIGLLLPRRLWNDRFKTLGTLWIIVLLGSIMLRLYTNRAPEYWEGFVYDQGTWWGVTLLIGSVFSFAFSQVAWLRRALEGLVDRLVVFLYLYLPLTAIAMLVVFARMFF